MANTISFIESKNARALGDAQCFLGNDYDTLNHSKIQYVAIVLDRTRTVICVFVRINGRFMFCIGNDSGWMPMEAPKPSYFHASLTNRQDMADMIYDHTIHFYHAMIQRVGIDMRTVRGDDPIDLPRSVPAPVAQPTVTTPVNLPADRAVATPLKPRIVTKTLHDNFVDEIKSFNPRSLKYVAPVASSPILELTEEEKRVSQLRPQAPVFTPAAHKNVQRQSSPPAAGSSGKLDPRGSAAAGSSQPAVNGARNDMNAFFNDMRRMAGPSPTCNSPVETPFTPVGFNSHQPIPVRQRTTAAPVTAGSSSGQNRWSLD